MKRFVWSALFCVAVAYSQSPSEACREKGFGNDNIGCAADRPCIKGGA